MKWILMFAALVAGISIEQTVYWRSNGGIRTHGGIDRQETERRDGVTRFLGLWHICRLCQSSSLQILV